MRCLNKLMLGMFIFAVFACAPFDEEFELNTDHIDGGVGIHKVPDIASSLTPSGHGFTCTGLAFDEVATNLRSDGKLVFWIGSDGRSIQEKYTEPFNGAIVQVALDYSASSDSFSNMPTMEFIKEIVILDIAGISFSKGRSAQGLFIDKYNTLWVTQFQSLLNVSVDGELISETISDEGFHGIAYDWENDEMLMTPIKDNGDWIERWSLKPKIEQIDKQVRKTSPSIDLLFMKKDDNKRIYASLGSNVVIYDLNSVNKSDGIIKCPDLMKGSEGVSIVGDYVYVVSDSYYHHTYTPPNESLGDVNALHKINYEKDSLVSSEK